MMRNYVTVLLLLFCAAQFRLSAQITLLVQSIPSNTPPGASIYAAGTFNNWDPGSTAHILAADGAGNYTLTVNPSVGTVKFKFTRGSWATVEGDANGNFLPDRSYYYDGTPVTLTLSILSWEDLGGGNGTAAPNVQIMDTDFFIPQLNRNRRIWLYLPPDYAAGNKHYPVLYMHDGQNLFDVATSFAGEWEVDESLNNLHAAGDYGCIVVGIDNGGQYRLDEYSPWINPTYGGGQGDEYVDFIASTLKPYIDANYRTLPGRHSTGIMGSSMGGLISMYAFSERQDVFSRAGIFSPAFWFAGDQPAEHVAAHPKQGAARVYFLAGGQEPASVALNMAEVADAMLDAGFQIDEQTVHVQANGEHSEWFWAEAFPAAYQWLFAGAVTSTLTAHQTIGWSVFPNPVQSKIWIDGPADDALLDIRITGADGKIWRRMEGVNERVLTADTLPAGVYIFSMKSSGESVWRHIRVVKL